MLRSVVAVAGVCFLLSTAGLEAGQKATSSGDAAAQWKIVKEKAPLIAEAYLDIQRDIALVGQSLSDRREHGKAVPAEVAAPDLYELLLCRRQAHRVKEGIAAVQALTDYCDYLVCRDRCRLGFSGATHSCMDQIPDIPEDCFLKASKGYDKCMEGCRQ